MPMLSRRILAFAFLFALFIIVPGLVVPPFPLQPLMQWADAIDLITPFVVGSAYWLLFQAAGSKAPSPRQSHVFMLLLFAWVSGHGVHLASNSIGHSLAVQDGAAAWQITYFYDEVLSHYLWNGATLALSAALIHRQWKSPAQRALPLAHQLAAAALYGFTLFCSAIEGQTPWLVIAFAIGVLAFAWRKLRGKLALFPVAQFLVHAHVLFLALVCVWGAYWRGLPEFSEVGIID